MTECTSIRNLYCSLYFPGSQWSSLGAGLMFPGCLTARVSLLALIIFVEPEIPKGTREHVLKFVGVGSSALPIPDNLPIFGKFDYAHMLDVRSHCRRSTKSERRAPPNPIFLGLCGASRIQPPVIPSLLTPTITLVGVLNQFDVTCGVCFVLQLVLW